MSLTFLRGRRALAVAFGLLLAAGAAAPAVAQTMKIAVLDTEKVLTTSETGKKALAELQTLRDQKETQAQTLDQQIQDLRQRLSDGRMSLSEDKLADLQKQYEDKTIEMKRFQDDANRELGKKRDEVLAAIDKKVMPIINQYGKEKGYDLIFRKFDSGLVYAAETVDITNDIIGRLDGGAAGQ